MLFLKIFLQHDGISLRVFSFFITTNRFHLNSEITTRSFKNGKHFITKKNKNMYHKA